MTDLVRHARSKWEWGGQPSRRAADEAAAHDDPQPAPRSPRRSITASPRPARRLSSPGSPR